jgi:hypothetical protein
MVSFVHFITLAFACTGVALGFPTTYTSLAGLPREELDRILPTLQYRSPGTPPGPLKFNGTKLVNDKQHPWKPLKAGDLRGPCPGLNTLASHGVRFMLKFAKDSIITIVPSIFPVMELLHLHKSSTPFRKVRDCHNFRSFPYVYISARFQHGKQFGEISDLCSPPS